MEPLDGNAIAGTLFEHFGAEMTTVRGTCGHCGATAQLAELRVYLRAPGTVGRCPACGEILLVLVTVGDELRVHASRLTLAQRPG